MAGVTGRRMDELINQSIQEGEEHWGTFTYVCVAREGDSAHHLGPASNYSQIHGFHSWSLNFNSKVYSMCLGDLVLGQL